MLNVTREEMMAYEVEQLEDLLQQIAFEMIDVATKQKAFQDAYSSYRSLEGEMKGLGEIKSAVQTLVRNKNKALGN